MTEKIQALIEQLSTLQMQSDCKSYDAGRTGASGVRIRKELRSVSILCKVLVKETIEAKNAK